MSERGIFAVLFSHDRLTTSMHESSRYIVVTTSLLVGEATKPSDIENTLCITSEARRRDEKHIVANRLLAPSREGAPGCSVLCVRYWTDTIFVFSFRLFPLPPSFSLSSSRSCFSSYLLSPFLPSCCPFVDEEKPWSVEDLIHIPLMLTIRPMYNAYDCSLFHW